MNNDIVIDCSKGCSDCIINGDTTEISSDIINKYGLCIDADEVMFDINTHLSCRLGI